MSNSLKIPSIPNLLNLALQQNRPLNHRYNSNQMLNIAQSQNLSRLNIFFNRLITANGIIVNFSFYIFKILFLIYINSFLFFVIFAIRYFMLDKAKTYKVRLALVSAVRCKNNCHYEGVGYCQLLAND